MNAIIALLQSELLMFGTHTLEQKLCARSSCLIFLCTSNITIMNPEEQTLNRQHKLHEPDMCQRVSSSRVHHRELRRKEHVNTHHCPEIGDPDVNECEALSDEAFEAFSDTSFIDRRSRPYLDEQELERRIQMMLRRLGAPSRDGDRSSAH